MKKLLIGFVSLIVGIVSTYAIWVQLPQLTNQVRVEKAFSGATARFEALQAQAAKPDVNGYLSPTFMPYWGRKGFEYQAGSSSERVTEKWNEYSSHGVGYRVEHTDLVTRRDPAYLGARLQFEKLVPELSEAIRKPYFVAPNSTLTIDAVIPNLIGIRACAQALCGLAESRLAEEKYQEAVQILDLYAKTTSICSLRLHMRIEVVRIRF